MRSIRLRRAALRVTARAYADATDMLPVRRAPRRDRRIGLTGSRSGAGVAASRHFGRRGLGAAAAAGPAARTAATGRGGVRLGVCPDAVSVTVARGRMPCRLRRVDRSPIAAPDRPLGPPAAGAVARLARSASGGFADDRRRRRSRRPGHGCHRVRGCRRARGRRRGIPTVAGPPAAAAGRRSAAAAFRALAAGLAEILDLLGAQALTDPLRRRQPAGDAVRDVQVLEQVLGGGVGLGRIGEVQARAIR